MQSGPQYTPNIKVTYEDESEDTFPHIRLHASKKRIYTLRHEEREGSTDYLTELTPKGIQRSETHLCALLESLNIDIIYCSPFIRTLQTILPFCQKTGLKVNIEWSLVESMPENPFGGGEFASIINYNYVSHNPY